MTRRWNRRKEDEWMMKGGKGKEKRKRKEKREKKENQRDQVFPFSGCLFGVSGGWMSKRVYWVLPAGRKSRSVLTGLFCHPCTSW